MKNRNPNDGPYNLNVEWPTWNAENKNVLEACCLARSKQNTFDDKFIFWTQYIPSLLKSVSNKRTKF